MLDLFFLTINFNSVLTFFLRNPFFVALDLFVLGGWLFLVYMLLEWGLKDYAEYRHHLHEEHVKYVLLAIDIPALNVQTPKAVEQLFSHIAGAYVATDIKKKFHDGYHQLTFSFEIISIEGYIQFLIRTEESLRDLVEAALYAQYPDAEVTEVEDYVTAVPDTFPNTEYDAWVADFTLTEHFSYPIRLYKEFEHSISKDTVLKDSMGTFLESFSRLGRGEQMWFQIIVEPTSNHWKEEAIEKIKELKEGGASHGGGHGGGHGGHGGESIFSKFLSAPMDFLTLFWKEGLLFDIGAGHEEHAKEEKVELAPGTGKLMEGMEAKIQKIGLETMMRGAYIARKEVFSPQKGIFALIGAVNQYNIPSANSIAPTLVGKKDKQKTKLLEAYKKRKLHYKSHPFVFNVEELATIWHFPMSHVKTPLVQKAKGKRAEPPSGLPIEDIFIGDLPSSEPTLKPVEEKKPYLTDAGSAIHDHDVKFG